MSQDPLPNPDPVDEPRHVVLLIEDDETVRRSLQLLLHWRGYDVRSFAGAGPVLDAQELGEVDALITDYRLPDGDGIGVLRSLRRKGWAGKAILITAFPSEMLTETARATGFDAVLEKPLRQHELVGALAS